MAVERVEEIMEKDTESFANVWANISLKSNQQVTEAFTYADLHTFIHEQLHKQNETAARKLKDPVVSEKPAQEAKSEILE